MAKTAQPPARADRRSMFWLQGLLCGALAALATPTALVMGVLLAPGLLGFVWDRAVGKPVARAMLLFGLSATVAPLTALWKAGHTMDAATALAFDPATLAIAWTAAAGGWLLAELAPLLARLALESLALSRKRRVRTLRARCAEEWGLPAASGDDGGNSG